MIISSTSHWCCQRTLQGEGGKGDIRSRLSLPPPLREVRGVTAGLAFFRHLKEMRKGQKPWIYMWNHVNWGAEPSIYSLWFDRYSMIIYWQSGLDSSQNVMWSYNRNKKTATEFLMHLNIIQQPRKKHHNIWVCLQIGYPQIQFTHYFPYQHGQIETPWSNTPVHNGWLYHLLYPHWYRRWLAVPLPPKKWLT